MLSDDGICSNVGGSPVKTFPYLYSDSNDSQVARYFTPHSYVRTAVLYKLGGPKGDRGMMPRGSSTPTDGIITGCRSYVICTSFSPGHYFAFSSARKMADSLHLTSMFMTRWMTLESLEHGIQNPESGGMIKTNEEYQRLDDIIKEEKVTWVSDVVRTVSQISNETDLTADYVYRFFQKQARVYLWRSDSKYRSMFISEDNIRVQFQGQILNGYYDGLMWKDALRPLASLLYNQTHRLCFMDRRIGLFVIFLENNFFQVRIEEKLTHIELLIRRGIWG